MTPCTPARLHAYTPAHPHTCRSDVESLVVVKSSKERTTLRHLLSADSRVERVAWCDSLNKALANLRAWDTSRTRSGTHLSFTTLYY